MDTLTNDTPPSEEDEDTPIKYVNRILVDDICSAVVIGISSSRPIYSGGRAYNCVDDDPAPRRDVMAEARRLLTSSIQGKEEIDSTDYLVVIMPRGRIEDDS